MATIISVEQGGTGVQTVQDLQDKLNLKSAAYKTSTDDYHSNSHNSVPTSYALKQALDEFEGNTSLVTPIERGGTGATTKEQAIKNLGIENTTIQYPVSIEHGGTGAETVAQARKNLGITLPLSIENGGTGATSTEDFIEKFNIPSVPIPIEQGGTGATSAQLALSNLGITLPLSIENGGTGASDTTNIIKNLFNNTFGKIEKEYLDIEFPLSPQYGGTGTSSMDELIELVTGGLSVTTLTEPIDLDILCKPGFYFSGSSLSFPNSPVLTMKNFFILTLSNKIPETEIHTVQDIDIVPGISMVQVVFTADRDRSIPEPDGSTDPTPNTYNRIFYRSYINKSNSPTATRFWSPWLELSFKETTKTTISASAPSGGKNGDIWYQYIN